MGRSVRYLKPGSSVETTTRTLQGRYFLRPCPEVKSIMIGVLARGQERFGMDISFATAASNHVHLILYPTDQRQLSRFMQYVNSNIARKVSRLFGWKEKFWGRRYRGIVISEDEADQVERLRYLMEHGAKENLVSSPREWPGMSSLEAYLDGSFVMSGHWVDHTAMGKEQKVASRQGSPSGKRKSQKVLRRQLEKEHTTQYKLELTPIRAWRNLSREEISRKAHEMVEEIELRTAARHNEMGTKPLGVAAVLSQRRETRPARVKRSYAPPVHAKDPRRRDEFLEGFREFVRLFKKASDELRRGKKDPAFPKGCFPPGLPFVEHDPEQIPA